MIRRLTTVLLAASTLGLLAGCGSENLEDIDPEVGVTQVSVEDYRYGPRVIQVPAGTEVTWTWEGNDRHNVVGEGFRSDVIRGGTFAHTFEEPGWYLYLCTMHAGMTGAVSVVE